jgi:hypothetical protein
MHKRGCFKDVQASTVYQFHNIYSDCQWKTELKRCVVILTDILQAFAPPISIPTMPIEAEADAAEAVELIVMLSMLVMELVPIAIVWARPYDLLLLGWY